MLSLTLLGVFQHNQQPKANQEIVLQFSFSDGYSSQAQHSLKSISSTLKQVGAKNISIDSNQKGFFKIAYYSSISVSKIEKIIKNKNGISVDDSSNTGSQKNKSYDFDVFTIDKGTTSSWDFEGQEVITFNFKSDRSFQSKVFKFSYLTDNTCKNYNLKSNYICDKLTEFVSSNTSYNFPETRAGPHTLSFHI